MDIEELRIGQRVEVISYYTGPYTGTVSAVHEKIGPTDCPPEDERPGVSLRGCEGNPSQLTWAYAEQIVRVIG